MGGTGHDQASGGDPARRRMKRARFAPLAAGLALAGCMVGPDYIPPPVLAPENFKELKGNLVKGWKLAAPRDRVDAGPWWAVYNDPTLDALKTQVEISNQTVAAPTIATSTTMFHGQTTAIYTE